MSDQSSQSIVIDALKKELKSTHVMYTKQLVGFLGALKEKFGPEVVEVIEKVNAKAFCKTILDSVPDPANRTIDELIKVLWEPLRKDGFQFTKENTADGVQMKCTVCPLAMLYKALGAAEWGYTLYCATDEHLAEAYSDSIGFKRTKTLMQGDDCCDHFYWNK